MVIHWKKSEQPGARGSMLVNGIGAIATGLTTCVVIVAKFAEGAWITVLAIPGFMLLMFAVHRHYQMIIRETASHRPAHLKGIASPIVVMPLQRWSRVAEKALRFAYTLSQDLFVLHIAPEGEDDSRDKNELLRV